MFYHENYSNYDDIRKENYVFKEPIVYMKLERVTDSFIDTNYKSLPDA